MSSNPFTEHPRSTQPKSDPATVLKALYGQAGYSSLAEFGRACTIGWRTLRKLREGQIGQIRLETIQRVARVLDLPTERLVADLSSGDTQTGSDWRLEYQRLRVQLDEQRSGLKEEWDRAFYRAIEPLLLQVPTVRAAAARNPDLPATVVLDLLSPLEEFLRESNFIPIGQPGEQTAYDPQLHQGSGLKAGEPVRVRTVGYLYEGRLLTRARVIAEAGT